MNKDKYKEKPHLRTRGMERSGLFESHVEWEQGLVTHRPQQISYVQHLTPELKVLGEQQGGDQIATAHQMCKSTPQELYNSVACGIYLKRICKDKESQQHHLLRDKRRLVEMF